MTTRKLLIIVSLLFSLFINNIYSQTNKIESYKEKVKKAQKQNNQVNEAKFLNKIAYQYWNQGKKNKALEYFSQSLEINKKIGNTHAIVVINNNMGLIYNEKNNYNKALEHFNKVLELRKNNNADANKLGSAYLNIAITYEGKNDYQEAIKITKKALEKFKEAENLKKTKTCYGMLAEDYEKLGNNNKSMKYYNSYSSLEKHLSKQEMQKTRQKMDSVKSTASSMKQEMKQKKQQIKEKRKKLEQTSEKLEEIKELSSKRQMKIELLNKQQSLDELKLQKQKAQLQREAMLRYFILGAAALLIVIAILIYRSYKRQKRDSALLSKQKEDIEKKNNELAKAHKDIQDSIIYGQKIQEALLPKKDDLNQYLKESFILFRPRDVVSGDFYWFHSTNNSRFLLAAVDCTGHGVPGAFMSMIGFNHLNEIVAENITQPAEVLNQLHLRIRKSLKQEETENNDGMDMALCAIDKKNKTLEFAGANNPLVYSQNGEMHVVKPDKVCIGGKQREKERKFTNHTISIEYETVGYIYSDGYQDQPGGEQGDKYMSKIFRDYLDEIDTLPLEEQKNKLENSLDNWMGNKYKQIDDILVIGFKV